MFQEARAKHENASGSATERAASAADIKDSRGPATDGALSASGANDPHLEKMYLGASSNTPPKTQGLLQELHAMGCYPNRYKQPANKLEKDSKSYCDNDKCCFLRFFGPQPPPEIFFSNFKN